MSAGIAKAATPALSAVGTLFQAAGQLQSGQAAYNQGVGQQQSYNYRAAEENVEANQVMGQASEEGANQATQNALVLSSVRARAAGNTGSVGIGATDVASQIAGRGEYDILSDLATGGAQAAGLKNQAALDTYMGQQALQAGQVRRSASGISAAGSLFAGASSLYAKYGAGGSDNTNNGQPFANSINDPGALTIAQLQAMNS